MASELHFQNTYYFHSWGQLSTRSELYIYRSTELIVLIPAVVRSESVRNIIRERRMLEYVNHPFICNLRYSFQDIEYMYV
jgi:hypothetical protein